MFRHVLKPNFTLCEFQVAELKALEIAKQNEARQVLVALDAGEVVEGLPLCLLSRDALSLSQQLDNHEPR